MSDLADLGEHRAYGVPTGRGFSSLKTWASYRDPSTVDGHRFVCTLSVNGRTADVEGRGNGQLAAFVDALAAAGVSADILDFSQHATQSGPGSEAVAYAECRVGEVTAWGAGQDTSVLTASIHAVLSAVNRAVTC